MPLEKVTWSLVTAVNSDEVLRGNLLRSDETNRANEVIIEWNAPTASSAYNSGMDRTTGDLIVFAHQDVFLPLGWASSLSTCVNQLEEIDKDWGVAGVYGVTNSGKGVGYVYSAGLRRFVGESFTDPTQVSTIDEMIIILRRSAGLRFDEQLPGFHLYGTDICLEAEAQGMKNYVLPCFAFHNSIGVKYLHSSFWQAYLYLRNKWKKRLPIKTPCTTITYGCLPIVDHLARTCWSSIQGKQKPGSRVDDPDKFYSDYIRHTSK